MSYQVMPPLAESEYKSLKAQIAENGVLVPIEYDDTGNILDGFHRIKACEELGIEDWPSITRAGLTETEKRTHARIINIARRHMSREQKQELIRDQLLDTPGWSNNRIAQVIGVDHKTVITIRKRMERSGQLGKFPSLIGTDNKKYPALKSPPDLCYKLTLEQQEQVTERVESGEIQEQIAADYGISRRRVGQIKEKIAKKKARVTRPDPDAEGVFHLIHGDMFTAELPNDVDLVITDFPYNISGEGKFTKEGSEAASFDAGEWDQAFNTETAIDLLAQRLRPGGALVFFADRIAISRLWEFCVSLKLEPKAIIVWHKTNPVPNARRNFMSATEFILWTVKPGAEYTWNGGATTHNYFECGLCQGAERLDHPTQKPKKLMAWLVKLFSNAGDVVLDPCAGMGTTGACGLNRQYWLIEKEDNYFRQMEERLQNG